MSQTLTILISSLLVEAVQDPAGLNTWLLADTDYSQVVSALPTQGNIVDIVSVTVAALERRGWVDSALLLRLLARRPEARAEIESLLKLVPYRSAPRAPRGEIAVALGKPHSATTFRWKARDYWTWSARGTPNGANIYAYDSGGGCVVVRGLRRTGAHLLPRSPFPLAARG